MSVSSIRGSCLCGVVTFEVSPPFQRMIHCHCSRCRKASGTGHATNLAVMPDRLNWLSGDEAIAHYDLPTAKSFGKWFCSRCGSPLPRLTRSGQLIIIPAGSLDSEPPIHPTDHIHWNSRVSWGCSEGALPTHAELPASW
jgi:hypothetical protein